MKNCSCIISDIPPSACALMRDDDSDESFIKAHHHHHQKTRTRQFTPYNGLHISIMKIKVTGFRASGDALIDDEWTHHQKLFFSRKKHVHQPQMWCATVHFRFLLTAVDFVAHRAWLRFCRSPDLTKQKSVRWRYSEPLFISIIHVTAAKPARFSDLPALCQQLGFNGTKRNLLHHLQVATHQVDNFP